MTLTVRIEDRLVGDGQPCYVVAEIGSNHNQDFDLARRHIDAAAEAGADAVKFQTFRAADHYSRRTPGFSYLGGTDTFALIESLEIDRGWHAPLQAHAHARGVEFFSSPCDADAVAEMIGLRVPAFKVASFDLTDTRLIGSMAAAKRPVILSTGMADWADIASAVEACHAQGNRDIVLLQCTSLYPAPADLSNLRGMRTMRAAFGVLTGYSDHTMGDEVCLAAGALGACVIEKHFTLDRTLPGPDHAFATEPAEWRRMVDRLRAVEAALGDGRKDGPRPAEQEMYAKGRRSLHARVDIPAGSVITDAMLTVKRPGLGVPPRCRDIVTGRVARCDIAADAWITWDMV